MNKVVLTALALATIAASSALAAPRDRALTGVVAANPTAVYFGGRYIGQDPDRHVRQQMLQDGAFSDN